MADSDAVRARRYRRHRAGDHSACRHARAESARSLAVVPGAGELDPRAEMRDLARRLREAHAAEPGNAHLGRELRLTLQALETAEEPTEDPIAWLRQIVAEGDAREAGR